MISVSAKVHMMRLTWVDWEEVAALPLRKFLIEIRPRNSRLYSDIHIFLSELQDPIHERKVDTNPAKRRRGVSLKTASTTVGNDRDLVLVADSSNGTDLFR